ncbi:chromosome-associated kinesin KIF4A [Crotalus adamanteus]|uniref:Chromosome-associated kinesin KIF4A n=1 Tax=Crotalus adamanteus TaxID=8729 RepID=A0AAW1C8I9_CROAD
MKMKISSAQTKSKCHQEIQAMKNQCIQLISQMKEDAEKFWQWKQQKDKKVIQLKSQDRKRQLVKLKQDFQKESIVLQQKAEAVAANKRLKEVLQKHQEAAAKQKDIHNGGFEAAASWVKTWLVNEVKVLMSIEEARVT